MRVASFVCNLSFGRALTNEELREYNQVLKKGKEAIGQTGKSIFIMPTQSLPQNPMFNTGISSISADTAQKYIEFMHSILDFNVLEDLPPGQISPYGKFYCNYQSSSLALGDQHINPELLTKVEFGNLLTDDDVEEIVDANNRENKHKFANFENIMDENGGQNVALKKAYNRFLKLSSSHPLVNRFNKYVEENSEWIDFLYKDKGDYFKFKQFLAEEHLKIGKEKLNKLGVKYCGDCLIGATPEEVKVRPNAFTKDWNLGWVLPTVNFEEILKEGSDANKYLEYKVKNFARRYDMIRFDVGWAYVQPRLINNANSHEIRKPNFDDKILNKIETWVKEVKGSDFDLKNLIWEFEAGPDDFSWCVDGKVIPPLENRVKVYSATHMSNDWGSNDAFLNRGFGADNFVIGVGNHDPQPLRQIAEDVLEETPFGVQNHKQNAIEPLARILNLDAKSLSKPIEFAKAKFAEPMMAKNMMEFFMDVFAYKERFDKQNLNMQETPTENYAHKVLFDFKTQYYDAVESGFGVNKMDSLEKIFKVKKLDEKMPELYKSIVKFRDILYENKLESLKKINEIIKEEYESKPASKNKIVASLIGLGALGLASFSYFDGKIKSQKTPKSEKIEDRPSLVKNA
ncbi:hypothetical protein IKU74_04715 [bacterium]|nr:hypothetical protein [bacterium]